MKGDNEIELRWRKCSLQMHADIHGSIKLQQNCNQSPPMHAQKRLSKKIDQYSTNEMQLTPYGAQATIVALHNQMQTFTLMKVYLILFAISMHAIRISDKSFVQLQRHTFNRNGVTSRTKFSYIYSVSSYTKRLQKNKEAELCAQKTDLFCSQSKHQNVFLLRKLSVLYILHWCFFSPHER